MQGPVNKQRQPLEGLKVLDFTRLLPGPLCTMHLGDYGAEVIKIEDTNAGDLSRFVGSFIDGCGSFYRQLNRNKKSVALNLKAEEGRKVAEQLARTCDVVVEGFRPGVMSRLGLGYDDLKRENPGLIYAAITGYGQKGPYRHRAGHDLNFCALSGMLDLSAEKGGPPVMPAVQVADVAGGSMMAISGIMMALYSRALSGEGSFVDISMTRGLMPMLSYAATRIGSDDGLPKPNEAEMGGGYAYFNIYETSDNRYMSLCAVEPVFWETFCLTAGKKEWIALQYEKSAQDSLKKEVAGVFREKTQRTWEKIFKEVEACCEPVLDLNEAVKHPLSKENGYWIDGAETERGTEKLIGYPLLFSGSPGEMRLPAPRHGEHTAEVMKALGYDNSVIAGLNNRGVILT